LSPHVQTRELVSTSHAVYQDGYLFLQEMQAAHVIDRERIAASRVSIAESWKALKQADALLCGFPWGGEETG
jgi:hypothetical protein